jgi:hypothetical protein
MKVICINAGDIKKCIRMGLIPLEEGVVYTLRGENTHSNGTGYLLEEIINDFRTEIGGEPSYKKDRFIPLSTIDEEDFVRESDLISLQY